MKTKSISLSVVKNLGNFQTVRYSIEIETETATEAQAFRYAKKIIEQAHHDNYGGERLDEKEILDVNSPDFEEVRKAVQGGKAIKDIAKYYEISSDAMNILMEGGK